MALNFTKVNIKSQDGDPSQTFNFKPGATKTLFEAQTIATISADVKPNVQAEKVSLQNPIYAAIKNDILVAASGKTVNCFSFNLGVKLIYTYSIEGDAFVCGITWLPLVDAVLIVLNDGQFLLCAPVFGQTKSKKVLDKCSPNCHVSYTFINNECVFCVAEESGVTHFVQLIDFEDISNKQRRFGEVINQASQSFQLLCSTKTNSAIIAPVITGFVSFPLHSTDNIEFCGLDCNGNNNELMFRGFTSGDSNFKAVKLVGAFIVTLDDEDRFHFWDRLTLMEVYDMKMEGITAIKSFEFLDVKPDEICLDDVKLLLHVETQNGHELQIRSLKSADIIYRVKTSSKIIILPESTDADNAVVYVDFNADKAILTIRFIIEAQPEMRLQRLLKRGQYDDAEIFAQTYNLDVQQVYSARIQDLIEQVADADENSIFSEVIKYCDLITNDNDVGEICIAGALKSHIFEWVVGFLSYADKRNITNVSTKQELEKYHYALGSYRMIYGQAPNVGLNSNWLLFIAGGSFPDIFDGFCHEGKVNEARTLWLRYPTFIREHLSIFENLDVILNRFYDAIITNNRIVNSVMDFLEYELIPFTFLHSFDESFESNTEQLVVTSNLYIDFIARIAHSLEGLCPETFPSNSLHVVLTMSRSLNFMRESLVSPDMQAKILLIFAQLDVSSRCPKKPMGGLNLFAEKLTKLARLYQTYQCRISYDDYLAQTKESICYLILERVHAVHLVKDHLEKFAIPYMKETNLKKDETLYTYINKVAQYGASIKAQTNPWDELCLTICDTIGNTQLKCKAIIDIAKRALPPWSKQLTGMVKQMMNTSGIDRSLIHELRRQCTLAELGQIFLSYQIPVDKRHEVHNINMLRGLICYIFCNPEKNVTTKLEDSFIITELVRALGISNVPSQVECYQLYAMRAIVQAIPTDSDEIELQPLINFMEAIKTKVMREDVAKTLILHWEHMIGGKEYAFGKVLPKKRLILISALLCILERFMPNSEVFITKIQLIRSIQKLQMEYGIFISMSEFLAVEKRICYLEEFVKNCKTVGDVVAFGNLLHIDAFDSFKAFINFNSKDSGKMINALSQLLHRVNVFNEEQLKFLNSKTFIVLKNIVALAEKNDTSAIIQIVKDLKAVSILLAFVTTKCLSQETYVFRLYGYLSLFDQLLDQCINDDVQNDRFYDPCDNSAKLHGKVYEINQRIGTFLPRNEGNVFETTQAVISFSNVALSILPTKSSEEFNNQMVDNWSAVFDFLNMHNQNLLEIAARSFAKNLDCFVNAQEFVVNNLPKSVNDICQKILTEPIADLWLAAYLILSLETKDILKLMNNLRQWCSNKKNTRVNLNLIRLTQFVLVMLKDTHYQNKINHWFTTTYWQKELSKRGISSSAGQITMDKLMPDFVREQIPPSILKQYCIDFKLDSIINLFEYGIALCYKAASEVSAEKCESILDVAAIALREVAKAEGLFNKVYEVLVKINPYNYEVIELLVSRMEEWSSDTNEQEAGVVSDCYIILKFLGLFNRQNGFTAHELKWYKNLSKDSTFDRATSPEPCEISTHESFSRPSLAALNDIYDQTKIAPSDLPRLATSRLPFHIFFLNGKKSLDEIVLPIVSNELTIYNVQEWCSAIDCCKVYMRLSRTLLVISSISNKINETVARDCELEDTDLEIIRDLLMDANPNSRVLLLQGLASNFKVLPLCRTKLTVLHLGLQVTRVWLASSDMDEANREMLEGFKDPLSKSLRLFTTHFILNENELLNATTSEMSNQPLELLQHIFVSETDWSEPSDIELKMKICNEIATANESDINEVHEKLIDIWLPGAEQSQVYSDPNATFEFGDVAGVSDHTEQDLILSIPYMDSSISRIVHILRARKPQSIARILLGKLNEDVNKLPGGYSTKLRIICCMLRSLSEEQLREFIQVDYNTIILKSIDMLNDRLLAISNVDISRKELAKMNRMDFVRSLVSPQSPYRQTIENTYLAMCLLIDNNTSVDIGLIEKVLRRLQGQDIKLLKALLQHARTLPNVESISNLAVYYSRIVDSQLQDLDLTNPSNASTIRYLIFFLISCPSDGRHHFNAINQRMDSMNIPVLSSLITLSANPAAIMLPLKDLTKRSPIDIEVQWESEIAKPNP